MRLISATLLLLLISCAKAPPVPIVDYSRLSDMDSIIYAEGRLFICDDEVGQIWTVHPDTGEQIESVWIAPRDHIDIENIVRDLSTGLFYVVAGNTRSSPRIFELYYDGDKFVTLRSKALSSSIEAITWTLIDGLRLLTTNSTLHSFNFNTGMNPLPSETFNVSAGYQFYEMLESDYGRFYLTSDKKLYTPNRVLNLPLNGRGLTFINDKLYISTGSKVQLMVYDLHDLL